jgi:hypothetical protein
MIETMLTPAVASQIAQVMTYVLFALLVLAAIQGVRDRVNKR